MTIENPRYIAKTRPGYWIGGGSSSGLKRHAAQIAPARIIESLRLQNGLTRGERRTHPTVSGELRHRQSSEKSRVGAAARALARYLGDGASAPRDAARFGLVLIVINRACGFVLPLSTRYLIDDVINKHQSALLVPLTLAVVGATAIQGITSFSLTQLLSIEGQKLIAELRRKVQEHIGRLPVTYYDSNKTGQMVSRIMSDVEGMRNLIGTGVIEFIGGLLTARSALCLAAADQPADDGDCARRSCSFSASC